MKYSRILSKQVLGQVISAGPDANFVLMDLAREIVSVLRREIDEPMHCRIFNTGGDTSYSMKVGTIAEQIPGGPTAHLVGRALRDLGFDSNRANIGYVISWNEPQIDILQRALTGEAASAVPCARCGGEVVEFSIPNDIWNEIIRLDGHEHADEYLCWNCFWHATRLKLAENKTSGSVCHD